MPTRVCIFTDTGNWYAGSRSKDAPFKRPLQEWADQIGRAHNRPAEGFEFEDGEEDPRTGVLVPDPTSPSLPPTPDEVFSNEIAAASTAAQAFDALKKWRASGE